MKNSNSLEETDQILRMLITNTQDTMSCICDKLSLGLEQKFKQENAGKPKESDSSKATSYYKANIENNSHTKPFLDQKDNLGLLVKQNKQILPYFRESNKVSFRDISPNDKSSHVVTPVNEKLNFLRKNLVEIDTSNVNKNSVNYMELWNTNDSVSNNKPLLVNEIFSPGIDRSLYIDKKIVVEQDTPKINVNKINFQENRLKEDLSSLDKEILSLQTILANF